MNKQTKIIGALLGAALAAASGVAVAESTYGYNSAGTGTVQASARVNLSILVPKLILLRVGNQGGTGDTISWTGTASWTSIPSGPVDGNNQAANWNGGVPSFSFSAGSPVPTNALAVYAWHNAPGAASATLTFTGTTPIAPSGGPSLADITVADTSFGSGTAVAHPGANLGTAAPVTLDPNKLYTRTWTYTLGGSPYDWAAGTYSGLVTYTATAL